MDATKQSRRKVGANKLEPIDWHEFANDAVLNGNMSTLYHRPPNEDPSSYASPEALLEIEKRSERPDRATALATPDPSEPTVGPESTKRPDLIRPTVGSEPTDGFQPTVGIVRQAQPDAELPTVGTGPTVGTDQAKLEIKAAMSPLPLVLISKPTVGILPTVRYGPTEGSIPTVGLDAKRKAKPIKDVQDALTLAGQVLYKAMYGIPDGAKSKSCTKGYRQLASETHLDKDTVRDLISEFKDKGIVRETRTYDSDTRSAKTYEVLSYKAILQIWRDAGLVFVTAGRQRPTFCTGQGEALPFMPTVGMVPTVGARRALNIDRPTVGLKEVDMATTIEAEPAVTGIIQALQQITGILVDQDAADRLIRNCRAEAADCTIEEITEFAWSKAFLCRSGKIANPVGFLITQIPKHFQGEAFQAYRETKRKELEAAAALAARAEEQRRESEQALAEMEERQGVRSQIAERHRKEQGIDLKSLLEDSEADEVLKKWAKRMLKLGHRYQPAI